MDQYAGLDVGLNETSICLVDREGSRDRRMLGDITKRVSKAMRQLGHAGAVTSTTVKGSTRGGGGIDYFFLPLCLLRSFLSFATG